MLKRQHGFDQACDASRRIEVADVGLQGANGAGPGRELSRLEGFAEGGNFDRVA